MESHEEYAARIAGIPVAQATQDQRRAAKALRFLSMYGGGSMLSPSAKTYEQQLHRVAVAGRRSGKCMMRVLALDYARQEAIAHCIQADQIRSLVESGHRILPGSTFSDIMVEGP